MRTPSSLVAGLARRIGYKWFLVRNRLPLGMARSSWSLEADDLTAIFDELRRRPAGAPLVYLELGSGLSTAPTAFFLRRLHPDSQLVSIEADPGWVQKTRELMGRYGISGTVSVHHVPYREEGKWFDERLLGEILDDRKFCAILVDAPPQSLSAMSRGPAIPFLLKWLEPDGVVFLHDAHRIGETEILKEWRRYFDQVSVFPTVKGLAVLRGLKASNHPHPAVE